jgi:hypothetical protein
MPVKKLLPLSPPPLPSSLDSFHRFNFFDLDSLSSADRLLKTQ